MLVFAYYEDASVQDRLGKFVGLHELTEIENNYLFQLSDPPLLTKLVSDNELVYNTYSS